jgi:hypothetical protein
MQFKVVVVDLEIPPRAKRLLLRVALPVAILLGGGALAYANVPKTWAPGETLTAADLNGNFSALDARVTALESKQAGHTSAVCTTQDPPGGNFCPNGYVVLPTSQPSGCNVTSDSGSCGFTGGALGYCAVCRP